MRKLITFLGFIIVVFTVQADGTTPLDLDCCISINEKLDQQISILKQHSELEKGNAHILSTIQQSIPSDKHTQPNQWYDIFGSIFGAIISALIAIGVFHRGKILEKNKEKAQKKFLLKSISLMLENVVKKCKKKIESIRKYNLQVQKFPWRHNDLAIIPMDEINRLKSLSIDRTFEAFFEFNIDETCYTTLYRDIDFVFELLKSMEGDYFKNAREYITSPSNEILKLNRAILDKCAFFVKNKNELNPENSYLLSDINNLMIDFYKNKVEDTNIDYIVNSLIEPLIQLIAYNNDPYWEEILQQSKYIKDLYTSICKSNKEFAQQLTQRIENINTCIKDFTGIITTINYNTQK